MDLNALNNGFGPLCRTRNEKVLYGIAFSAIVVLISLVEAAVSLKVFCYSDTDNIHLVSTYCAMASSLILGEVIRRLTLFTEEVRHADERYNGSKLRAFQKCLTFGNKTKVVYAIFTLSTVTALCYNKIIIGSECFLLSSYVDASIGSFFMFLIGAQKLSQTELSHLAETEIKNVADGLASGYYCGYLKLLLPHLDDVLEKAVAPDFVVENDDMKNAIQVKKLFIIISKNCSCYEKLINADPDHIQDAGKLPSFYMTRAGVHSRAYQQSLYRVKAKEKPVIYVMMEYATPLLTLNDMSHDDIAELSLEERNMQIMAFYNKLKFILDNAGDKIRNRYQLVLLSDVYSDKDKHLSDVIYKAVHDVSINVRDREKGQID